MKYESKFENEPEDDGELGSTCESTTNGAEHSGSETDNSKDQFEQEEDRLVSYSKGMVILVIVSLAVAMGIITYVMINEQENEAFKIHFRQASSELAHVSQARVRDIFSNLEAFSATLTSFARVENATWPTVNFPDFQVHAMVSNEITGASILTIVPIVRHEDRANWEAFSVNASKEWLAEGHAYDKNVNPSLYVPQRFNGTPTGTPDYLRWNATGIVPPFIYDTDGTSIVRAKEAEVYYPAWQTAPAYMYTPFSNVDLTNFDFFSRVITGMLEADRPVLTEVTSAGILGAAYELRFDPEALEEPHSYLFQPIYDSLTTEREAVAILMAFFGWSTFFKDVLPTHEPNILIVLYGTCNQTFSYELRAGQPVFLGEADFHNPEYEAFGVDFDIANFAELPETSSKKYCQYNARIYPTKSFQEVHTTNNPYYYAAAVLSCFIITTLVFVAYDYLVSQRQQRLSEQAAKTTQIVNSIFPANVRDRLLDEAQTEHKKKKTAAWNNQTMSIIKGRKGNGVDGIEGNTSEAIFGSKPIADFFPDNTIMFGDLVGFTAWSSMRDPTQVFTLLETLYHSFDTIARKLKVFKVETIGDCYVAVAGLPEPQPNHAVIMARFASACLESMTSLVHHLETSLGPETATLAMRIGLHSGPVTAGVLRGEKGRFQLFGDTMNTASRMESTGERGKIQVSLETADLLIAAGKGKRWLKERQDKVHAKGKGELITFWLSIAERSGSTTGDSSVNTLSSTGDDSPPVISSKKVARALKHTELDNVDDRTQRLVKWNFELLAKHLKEIIARRSAAGTRTSPVVSKSMLRTSNQALDEVRDVLELPCINEGDRNSSADHSPVALSPKVEAQLYDFISKIASRYPENPFHNFEHASHVTMSVTKLLGRITGGNIPSAMATDNTFAMKFSDPLVQFSACASALFHDAEHPGVANSVLVQENDPLAILYAAKSVSEQHSVDVCWQLLMQPKYNDLHSAIFAHDAEELRRFRSLIVQCVLSTDIQDSDLGSLRRARWEKAFSSKDTNADDDDADDVHAAVNRKATIVLEHLMQASDVAHTMQHWHVFHKWNECLFQEVYFSYLDGRVKNDPSKTWYQSELAFFDNYVIPLAKKLETCGVFGVSSHEYLGYAQNNRMEWKEKGEALVQEYVAAAIVAREKKEEQQNQEDISISKDTVDNEGYTACAWV